MMTRFILILSLLFSLLQGLAFARPNAGFATVLIDMQEGFYERGGTLKSTGLNSLVQNQIRLLRWSVANDIPVLVFEYDGYGKTDPRLMKILAGHTYKVIQKNFDGGFFGISREEALSTLQSWDVDSLIVAGINGPYCVKSTIKGALDNGYDVMTTAWVIGEINQNPPTFPNGSWYFKDSKFTVFPTLESIINQR
jgi:nicotinamidase-related amidase